ncbi:MAG: enoyl-CoA hydratase-related protein [SAR324 cluster bacterium]|nr:enoyl-CoA hydratase-related protein [SAR324 cluster bacterium]
MAQAPVTLRSPGEGRAELVFHEARLEPAVCAAALGLLETLREQDGLRVVTLRGGSAGDSAVGAWPLPPETPDLEGLALAGRMVEAVAALPTPVLAVMAGEVRAEGLELALACDLRLAARSARFAMPHLAEGRLPCCGGSQRLPRLVGLSAAFELFFAEGWDAERAEALGLLSEGVAAVELAGAGTRWAERLAEKAPIAARFLKEVVRRGMEVPLDQGLLIEEDAYLLLQTTEDRLEGIRAFLEKRPPRFKGK